MGRLRLVVAGIDDTVPAVRRLVLAAPQGGELPSYTPGSHLVLDVPAGAGRERALANAYSLVGEGLHPSRYEIAVLLCDPHGGAAGGSAWVHTLRTGDPVTAMPPRSSFAPVQAATRHLLVAAGIGITPLVSHLRFHARWGREAELLYLHRAGRGALLDEVAELTGGVASPFHDRADLLSRLRERLLDQPIGTHLYTCGPTGFMDLVVSEAQEAGWPASRIHLEHFGLDDLDPGEPFDVTVGERRFEVASGVSLLEAMEQQGYAVPNLCRQGVCGECRLDLGPATTGVWHRDLYLTDDDKAAGDCAMACVSRALPAADGRSHLEVSL
ncbi:MAG: oxidoreductase [Pimelobacter sp.]|nr:oxidoreductase [Pimelobacter sp.]